METKHLDMKKQVYLLLGLLLFAFVNVFLFDDKEGIGFSVFSTLTLLTIGLLSRRRSMQVLGIVSYVVNILAALLGLNYVGWLTGLQAIEMIFVVWYLYPQERFLRTDETDKFLYRYRWSRIVRIIAVTVLVYVAYFFISDIWDNSFLEFGGNTAFIFVIQYFLFSQLTKARAEEEKTVSAMREQAALSQEIKLRAEERYAQFQDNLAKATQPTPTEKADGQATAPLQSAGSSQLLPNGHHFAVPAKKATFFSTIENDTYVKIASVWLIVMDMSILAYFIRPNDFGFGVGAFFVLLSIVLSLFFKTKENPEDVFSVIYHKIRPVQPVFFILLLIAHAHKFSYGAAYALLFAAAYFIWAINRINMKTLITLTVLIYFMPIVGYLSNPFRLGASTIAEATDIIFERGGGKYFHIWDYSRVLGIGDGGLGLDDMDEENSYLVSDFSERITVYPDGEPVESGIWDVERAEYELTFSFNTYDYDVEVDSYAFGDYLYLSDLSDTYKVYKNRSETDNVNRYQDFYRVGEIESEYGTYQLFLQMDEEWVAAYETDPTSVDYVFLVVGSNLMPQEAYERTE